MGLSRVSLNVVGYLLSPFIYLLWGVFAGLPSAAAAAAAPNPSAWLGAKAAVVFLSRCHYSFPITYKRGVELMRRLEDALAAAQVRSAAAAAAACATAAACAAVAACAAAHIASAAAAGDAGVLLLLASWSSCC